MPRGTAYTTAACTKGAVLFLTAHDWVQDRVKGLELSTVDYLVKPFSCSELLARVRAMLRPGQARQPEIVYITVLEVDLV